MSDKPDNRTTIIRKMQDGARVLHKTGGANLRISRTVRGVNARDSHRLPLFDLTDETIDLLEARRSNLEGVAETLGEYLTRAFSTDSERVLGMQSRVKAADSLRQKILRKNMYVRYNSADDILANLSDLIGVRVECRFLDEENILYETLRRFASNRDERGFGFSPEMPSIAFDWGEGQPQLQQNGFPIYRIDGYYTDEGGETVRFELQIKALVHVFWAEVEHEIIYKNNAYLLMDNFMKDMLNSTYDHLKLVDSQLHMIYDAVHGQSDAAPRTIRGDELERVVAKGISDIFFAKMQRSLGFTIDFRASCDVLSHYILRRAYVGLNDLNVVTMIFHRVAYIGAMPMDFESTLTLESPLSDDRPFCRILGDYFAERLNTDYSWNTFFRMLFIMEPGNNSEDLSEFIKMLYDRFAAEDIFAPLYGMWRVEEINEYRDALLGELAKAMVSEDDISIIYEANLKRRERQLTEIVEAAARSMGSEPLTLPQRPM